MRARVYIETSVVSYYAARPSRDLVTAARQQVTREWWENELGTFDAYVSALVVREASAGDPQTVPERLTALADMPVLEINEAAESLAAELVERRVIPAQNVEDALHIALAAVHGMDYLVTWNFRHLNNARAKFAIETAIADRGLYSPVICSPEELMGGEDEA